MGTRSVWKVASYLTCISGVNWDAVWPMATQSQSRFLCVQADDILHGRLLFMLMLVLPRKSCSSVLWAQTYQGIFLCNLLLAPPFSLCPSYILHPSAIHCLNCTALLPGTDCFEHQRIRVRRIGERKLGSPFEEAMKLQADQGSIFWVTRKMWLFPIPMYPTSIAYSAGPPVHVWNSCHSALLFSIVSKKNITPNLNALIQRPVSP